MIRRKLLWGNEKPGSLEHNHVTVCKGGGRSLWLFKREIAAFPCFRVGSIKPVKRFSLISLRAGPYIVRSEPVLPAVTIRRGGYGAGSGGGFANEQFHGTDQVVVGAAFRNFGNVLFPDLRVNVHTIRVPRELRPAECPFSQGNVLKCFMTSFSGV